MKPIWIIVQQQTFHSVQSALLVHEAECRVTEKYVNCSIFVVSTPPDFVQDLQQIGLPCIVSQRICEVSA